MASSVAQDPLPPGASGVALLPPQEFLPDFRRFRFRGEGTYTWRLQRRESSDVFRLVVGDGFEHDFASVPRLLWAFISPLDLGVGSVFHDWLYRNGGMVETLRWNPTQGMWTPIGTRWTRKDADRLFARIMREQHVSGLRRKLAFKAVHWFGKGAWKETAGRSDRV